MRPSNGNALSALQDAILLTVVYSDLFDYPLTDDELRRYLTARCAGDRSFTAALDGLIPHRLSRRDGYVTLPGREGTVDIRRRRRRDDGARWAQAARYGRWLRHVPFVRMVAVCGSQAAGNPCPDADVDFFIITAPDRLWTVQVVAMMLRRVASLFSLPVCPNYFLTTASLEVAPHDLYHAREIAQTVPLWGGGVYRRFLAANRWVDELLPNLEHADDRRDRLAETEPSRGTRFGEWLLAGRLGAALERGIHAALLRYYELRLRRLGWRREQFREAYRPDRQEVVRGGYGPVVEAAFRRSARRHLPGSSLDDELQRLFPMRGMPAGVAGPDAGTTEPGATEPGAAEPDAADPGAAEPDDRAADPGAGVADRLFAELFEGRYGGGR